MKCPNCGTDNPAGEDFCSNCGAYLSASATSPTIVSNTVPTQVGNIGSTTLGGSGGSGALRSLTPGARLDNGRYVIEKILGQGGMGAALLARDTRVSNKLVVIKELLSDNTDPVKRQEDVRNFEREVETLAHIDHPLVPNVTDSFHEGTRYFMVQEYVDGENLEDRLERTHQPVPERDALNYASQILDVLDYLAQQKPPIVHRDIKPANIIISKKDKRAHLVDFGIARADVTKNAKRKQTSALGTPGYAPPEQYQGNADPRSDLYALAATLHHILTNRDPRNYPPFAYPSARTSNPQLSMDIERVLNRALLIDVNKRYQTAADMKRDIDDILMRRFGIGNTGSYTLGTSGPISATSVPSAAPNPVSPPRSPGPPSQPSRMPPPPPRQPQPTSSAPRPAPRPTANPAPYQQPYPQAGGYTPPPSVQQPRRTSNAGRNLLLLLVVLVLIFVAFSVLPGLLRRNPTGTGGNGATPTTASSIGSNGIGVTTVNGEAIGISDGTIAFDTSRPGSDYKTTAGAKLKQGDAGSAVSLWNQAIAQNTNDAEALIYLENQRIINSPHITFVVGTMLTGGDSTISVGRSDLQGAYVAQKEFNDGSKLPGGLKVRLLIANAGSSSNNATMVANQVVQLAQADKTFMGVMGWPYSQYAYNAVQILGSAHIPMVSQTASSDSLTGASPYFFRVAPSNKTQGIAGAKYAEDTLHAKNVALFVDPANQYSQSLAQDFVQQFHNSDGNAIAVTENYTVGTSGRAKLPDLLSDAVKHNPDLIYFAGYSDDISTLLTDLQSSGAPDSLQILGGDALYELGGYQSSANANLGRLKFTAFFYPDEWELQGLASKKPSFFQEYPAAFDPNGLHQGSPYGFTRPDNDGALSYDAMVALLNAYTNAGKTTTTAQELATALATTKFQGVSGQVTFGPGGDPVNKAIVILNFDASRHIHFDKVEGKFLL